MPTWHCRRSTWGSPVDNLKVRAFVILPVRCEKFQSSRAAIYCAALQPVARSFSWIRRQPPLFPSNGTSLQLAMALFYSEESLRLSWHGLPARELRVRERHGLVARATFELRIYAPFIAMKPRSDPIQLELMRNLFEAAAEEMGITLQRVAFSANIKERRDFSCALFDASAELLAQAAHIPVHLGSMPQSVRAMVEKLGDLRDGDVAIVNDPFAGGTHLPDITI